MFVEKILTALKDGKPPVVVGIDPDFSQIKSLYPDWVEKNTPNYIKSSQSIAHFYLEYSKIIIDAVYDLIPAVKPQSAFFEMCGHHGIAALEKTIHYARDRGLLVIVDVKRGDVPSTAQAYANAYLRADSPLACDAVTVNPFLGGDSLDPFFNQTLFSDSGGVFVLLKTSNPGSGDLQDLVIGDRKLYEYLATLINEKTKDMKRTPSGYSNIGVVVGGTYPEVAKQLRRLLPHCFFLVPGLGAQGGNVGQIKDYLNPDGLGALFNFSRSVVYPSLSHPGNCDSDILRRAIRQTLLNYIKEVSQYLLPSNKV